MTPLPLPLHSRKPLRLNQGGSFRVLTWKRITSKVATRVQIQTLMLGANSRASTTKAQTQILKRAVSFRALMLKVPLLKRAVLQILAAQILQKLFQKLSATNAAKR